MRGRYFVDALEGIEEETSDSIAYRLLVQMAKIFHIEAKLQKRTEKERVLVEQVFVWAKTAMARQGWKTKKEEQALKYLIDNEEGLKVYLEDGSVPMTNSLVERTIRSFAIGRRN